MEKFERRNYNTWLDEIARPRIEAIAREEVDQVRKELKDSIESLERQIWNLTRKTWYRQQNLSWSTSEDRHIKTQVKVECIGIAKQLGRHTNEVLSRLKVLIKRGDF